MILVGAVKALSQPQFSMTTRVGRVMRAAAAIRRTPTETAPFVTTILSSCQPRLLQNTSFHSSALLSNNQNNDPSIYRHANITFHPEAIGKEIFPDGTVKKRPRPGSTPGLKRPLELEYGYFWMLRELRYCKEKPIVSSTTLWDESTSEPLPPLTGVESLSKKKDGDNTIAKYQFPQDLLTQNRTQDPSAQCTILTLSFRDFGYQLLPAWIEPLQKEYAGNPRVQIVKLNMTEGGWLFRMMSPMLKYMIQSNTGEAEREYSYMYYDYDAVELSNFQFGLGLHNLLTCYVLLLDGVGRVRWMASGPAQDEELQRLTRQLIPQLVPKVANANATMTTTTLSQQQQQPKAYSRRQSSSKQKKR